MNKNENNSTPHVPFYANIPRPLTIHELQSVYGWSRGKIRNLMLSGSLKYIKLGKQVLFDPADIASMFDNFKQQNV